MPSDAAHRFNTSGTTATIATRQGLKLSPESRQTKYRNSKKSIAGKLDTQRKL